MQPTEPSATKSLFGDLTGSATEDKGAPLQKLFFANYHIFGKWGTRFRALANGSSHLPPAREIMENVFGVDHRRMLADTFTNYGSPKRGMAAVRVLRAIGADVVLSPSIPDGRAAMSQGMIETARPQARTLAKMLAPYLDQGRKIVVVEPSVLAMLRFDFRHLLDDESTVAALATNSFEPLQALWDIASERGFDLAKMFPASKSHSGTKLFYHAHCQQKTCNAAWQTVEVLRAAGFDVVTSTVEWCGMAGEDAR